MSTRHANPVPRLALAAGLILGVPDMIADPNLEALRRSNEGLRRFVLENGLVGLVKENHSAPAVAVQIWVGCGSVHEEEFLGGGLSHYLEHMVFKGTPTRGATEITRQIDEAGGEINAYTTFDRTVFFCEMPSRNWRVGLDVLADAVRNAVLPEDEWQREKEVILREFAMGNDDPDNVAQKLLWSSAFRVSPYRFPVIGVEDVFRSMSRQDLLTYMRRHYVPDNMIVAVAGAVDAAQVEGRLREVFGDWSRRARRPVLVPSEPPQVAPRAARKAGPYNVTRLQMAWHTVPLGHPDAPALDTLAQIVGQGRSSRLVARVKEKEKLAYEIGAWSFTPRETGILALYALCEATHEARVAAAIDDEIAAWAREGFREDEIEKARRNVLVGELSGLQSMAGQAASYAAGEFFTGNPRYAEAYLEAVARVTPGQLRDLVRRYLRPENRTVAVLAPESAAPAAPVGNGIAAKVDLVVTNLPQGVRLVAREDHTLPMVHLVATVNGGLLSETEDHNGVGQLCADLLTRGAAGRNAAEIAAEIERMGASVSAIAGRNSLSLSASGLASDAERLAEIFSDCLLRPSFPEAEVEKQRAVQKASIAQQREQPMYLAQQQLREMLYPGHPYRLDPLGTEASLDRITPAGLKEYHRRHVVAGNLVLAVFGDLTADAAARIGGRILRGLPAGARVAVPAPPTPPAAARRERREPREQAIFLLGFPSVDVRDPRADALNVLQKSLSGLSSDLGIEVREKRGLVYFVGALHQPGVQPGHFAFYAGTREEAVPEVERLVRAEIARVLERGLRPEELNRAREQLLSANDMNMQNNGDLAQICALNELYGLGARYSLDLPARLAGVTPETVRDAARAVFDGRHEALSLVFPEASPEEKKP